MAIWVNADEMIERLKWDFDDQYVESILGDVASFNADMVEVVRCKDCKHNEDCIRRIQFWGRNPVLELNTTEYHPIDFCSYGERKDKW